MFISQLHCKIDCLIVVPHVDERNLECPNHAFGEFEGCPQRHERASLTFTPILQFLPASR